MEQVSGINVFGERGTPEVEKSINQFLEFINECPEGTIKEAALMPDCHAGYSVPIGSVFASDGVIFPSAVGYDIGCGMCAYPLNSVTVQEVRDNAKAIFDQIYRDIPVGFNHNATRASWDLYKDMETSDFVRNLFEDGNALYQLGTLGGGNHFIEIGADAEETVWIIIHSGSRNLGHKIASQYMKLASGGDKAKEGAYGFDVQSSQGKAYINDMNLGLEFALANRKEMIQRVINAITKVIGQGDATLNDLLLINRNHNHAVLRDGLWIHRKGATHAEEGMGGVIPGNMRDGSFIVRGKGNANALYSSSHGAGRVMGRMQAKRELNMDDFKKAMGGIQALVQESTIDESPFAYKDVFHVMELQTDLVEVVAHVTPIVNIKG